MGIMKQREKKREKRRGAKIIKDEKGEKRKEKEISKK